MKLKKQFLKGCGTGVFVWAVFMAADTVDEYLLDTDTFLGMLVFFGMLVIMFIKYILRCIKHRSPGKMLAIWLGGYYAAFLPIWWIVYNAVNERNFIITQKDRSDWLNLNGIEYIFYGFSVLLAFSALCLIFHFIRFIVKHIKRMNNKNSNSK